MLTNILGNAAKFTKKGRIKIETSRASDNSSLIEIRISDTGGGIPKRSFQDYLKNLQPKMSEVAQNREQA